MAGGSWDGTSLPIQPGLYINFVQAAAAQIRGGARGTVAIPLLTYANTATAKTFYTVETEKQAVDLFGAANIQSILFALQGGAKEVLVYTMPDTPATKDYTDMRDAFDARPFNVFVFDGEFSAVQQAATKTWVVANRNAGKHFAVVIGGDATTDATPTQGDTRSTLNSDDYIVNLINGVTIRGDSFTSSEFSPWVAGLIAGTAINRSITYTVAPVDDVTKRLTNTQINTSLAAGSLILVNDGEKVKIVQGVTTAKSKIRSIRARQAIATDVSRTAEDNYIGKLNNNADGQATLIVAIKAYLENLATNGVLTAPVVGLDPQRPSVGDSVFLSISYVEVDSIERIFITVNI
ncbi:phage tail sheath subtilisin-like domain-containing protein [Cohnella mopanensis]|uniref:phage tail sheath subtilisin-like domain-containing protein n=1 Tax=Cohnella mopanensis TaxID=2911966 RepID=UPI001EF75B02|nr:phage tail sheath subtilisin-like domain-containing protein [Cohnella mopanensis]